MIVPSHPELRCSHNEDGLIPQACTQGEGTVSGAGHQSTGCAHPYQNTTHGDWNGYTKLQ